MSTLLRTIRYAGLLALVVHAAGCKVTDGTGLACTEQFQCPGALVCSTAGHCVASCPSGQRGCAGFCQTDNQSCGTDPGAPVAQAVGPGGGTVSNGDNAVKFPPGSLPASTTITSTETPGAPPPLNVVWVGPPYTLAPEGLQFSSPVTVTFEFDPAKIPAGKTAADIAVYTAPVGTTNYVSLGGTLIDATHISAQMTHFCIVGPGVPVSPDGGSSIAAPKGLSYSANPAVYARGTQIAPNMPSTSGGGAATSYSIDPALSSGLLLDSTSGVLTGTPTVIAPSTNYTVTATNTGGSTTVTLTITVTDAAPSELTYATNPAVFTINQPITPDHPANGGGAVASYSVNPSLPQGLIFDTGTGIVSGTPTEVSTASCVVTATNAGGSTTATLSIAVIDIPPSGLVYAAPTAVYTLGQAIAQNTVTSVGGGTVVTYSVAPALPAGLTLKSTTGAISGTPTVLSPAASYTVTATNSGGTTTATLSLAVVAVPPSSLSYATNPVVSTINQAITNDAPTISGGVVVSWAITPALPAGLSLDPATGALSGTPTVLAATRSYTITATNSGGSTSVGLTLTVNDVPPSTLAYTTNPAVYTLGQAITGNAPSSSGGAVISYSISPALPAGLSFDTSLGVIGGTPAALSVQTAYTVTATNSGGSTTVTLHLGVVDVPPASLTYATNPATFTKGLVISSDKPSSSGGPVVSYAISPALPAGLVFNTGTGIVSGTPSVLSAATGYTVTATNSGGSTNTTLSIQVNDQALSLLTYAANPAIYTNGQVIPDNTPSNSGGTVLSYSISPDLPEGLSLSPTTGIISGTPTVVSAETTYTVTATNGVGSTTVSLIITVNDVPPSELTYPVPAAVYTIEQSITANAPESSVGVTSYSIAPALPEGLSFDTTTGTISGTPIVLSSQAYYTVTAFNSGGSAMVTLSITVVDAPPSGLTYPTNPAIYTKSSPITANVPFTTGGGPVVSFAITPALPLGLVFDTGTGAISGTPGAVAALNSYLVTATNSGGSTTATLSLTVNDVAPSSLLYATTTASYTRGVQITPNAPQSSVGVIGYSIAPTLPAGLMFDTTTGTISGTPSALSQAAYYTVTATNSGGSATTTLSIAVVDVPPSAITYPATTVTCTRGTSIIPDIPGVSGGPVVSWAISPLLPTGLSFSTTTGTLSGTPGIIAVLGTYTVTATNSGGSAQVSLFITVNDVAPAGLSYSSNPVVYTKGRTITNNAPSSSGGPVTAYTIAPALPAGLSFSTVTGVISGAASVVSAITNYTVTAANSGGSTQVTLQITVNDVAPSGLRYSVNPAVYTLGAAITSNVPSNVGGAVVSWSISPTLPAGLTFDTTTGIVSGTPTALSTVTNYTVQATNSGGATNATLTITVNDLAPSALAYPTNPAIYTEGQAITSNVPTASGGPVVSWSILPALPAGLTFSSATGAIAGTPTVLAPVESYTVTAMNTGGSAQVTLQLTVNDVAPSALSYTTNPAIYTKGTPIPVNTPVIGGGPVVAWSVSPALPSGLSLSTTTGVVSGTPAAVTAMTAYTITATNTGGSATVQLTITVNDVAPSSLTYAVNPAVFTIGQAITPDTVGSNVGITSYSISPALPTGLSFDTTTGTVSGTPSVLAPAAYYTVTAHNSGGSTTAQLSIAVVDVPPSGLTYTTSTATYTKGTAITNNTPATSGGGAVISYAISPALPTGLSFSTSTGVISGTPDAVSAATVYTATATNSGGSTAATLHLTVNDVAPTSLAYTTSSAVYTKGQAITTNTPTNGGGTVVSYSVSPALPAGLSLNPASGTISGTPTVLASKAFFTVTAMNSGGSTQAMLSITVNDVAPSGLTYATNPAVFTKGAAITADAPTAGGGSVTLWSITPTLPLGLSLSSSTGVLSGTPTALSTMTTYTVTALNSGGSTQASLQITVNDVPPALTNYTSGKTTVDTLGQQITEDDPVVSGGPVTSWQITPALPSGLALNAASGAITGTPLVLAVVADYMVTAANSGGSSTLTLNITVKDVAPSSLSYAFAAPIYTKGQSIMSDAPSSSGGPVVTYAIAPALPSGLSLSASTGVLSGTPSVVSATTGYTVTATNSGGSSQAALSITVNDVAPSTLTYILTTAVYTKGTAITSNAPSNGGGVVISYAINPSLPAGLSLNTGSGLISGTPSVLSAVTSYTVTATNSGGSTSTQLSITVDDVPPSALSYATPSAIYTNGSTITSNTPTSSGGPVVSWSVSPALPAGLTLNTTTGIISGKPTAVAATASYTVTATNSGGSTSATLSITVNDVPPSGLTYSTNPATFTLNTAVTPDAPTTAGGGAVISYSILPALSAGLSLDPATGIITGAPTVLATAKAYTVTATNSGGSTTVTLTITVVDVAPSSLVYSTPTAVYTKGTVITFNTPSSSGGAVISYSVIPALPTGLSLNTTSGVISGTPSVLSTTPMNYTITATNTGGSTQGSVNITVNDVVPSGLTYATQVAVYTKGTAITSNTPSVGGGPVVSWSINPSIPAGLSFSTTSGIISGTPNALATFAGYTVTATNSGGSTNVTIDITVNDVPPSGLTYTTATAVYTKGTPIASDSPSTSGGGPVTSYSVSPSLPGGLAFNTTTGVISGTPDVLSTQATTYTVTAYNSGGSTMTTLTITVNDVAPSSLTYSTSPAVYTKGTPITSNTPSSGGGPAVSYAVTPPLPTGLSLSTTTGVISGTPTVLAPQATYMITATNSGGSFTGSLSLTVNDVPPSGVSYSTAPATYFKGVPITNNTPTVAGGGLVISWGITPTLPTGLSLSTTTGVISGTPSVLSTTPITYTVTATNTGGSGQVMFAITVNDVPPVGLAYSANPAIYNKGVAITTNTPSTTGGGAVTAYAVSPALPAGLSLSTSSGQITGTPTGIVPMATYTVTASNSGGSTTVALTITVNDVAPTNLQYEYNPAVYSTTQLIAKNAPTSSGGVVVSYAVSPPLPAGLTLNTTSGVVTGTPTAVAATGTYTVTATNTGGSTTAGLVLTVSGGGIVGLTGVIAVGGMHTCAIVNGGVQCWGNDVYGQLGNGSTAESNVPVQVSGLTSGATTVVAGDYHTCAIVNGGTQCWGYNGSGELGNNSTSQSLTPVQVSGLTSGVQVLAAGWDHTCAIVNGGIKCWGYNISGQLGNNSFTQSDVPVQVSGLTSGAQALTAGESHTCALVNGGVQCWGIGGNGQLGNGTTTNSTVPVHVSGLTVGVQALAAGSLHTCALSNGLVECWGLNSSGQLGNNTTVQATTPTSGGLTGVQAISAGPTSTCLLTNGGVRCCGNNQYGELGNNSTATSIVAVQATGLSSGVQAIALGAGTHGCALVNGALWCWGDNTDGDLGNGSTTQSDVAVQVSVLTSGLQGIAAGSEHTCGLVSGGVQCWGGNSVGQLGNNSNIQSDVPVQVVGLTSGVQAVAAGYDFTCALVNGGVECWGSGDSGQLGNDAATSHSVPVQVSTLTSGVQAIAAGQYHACALLNGGVKCWGLDLSNQLGDNNSGQGQSSVPVQALGLTIGVQAVAAGADNTCVVQNGAVLCFGGNSNGGLGNNSTTQSTNAPIQVTGLTSGAQAISAGEQSACALVNGGLQCWGNNSDGEIGNNSTAPQFLIPAPVSGLTSGVQAIASNNTGETRCALVNGGAQCWGYNSTGALGNNSSTSSLVPVQVSGLTSGVQSVVVGAYSGCVVVNGGVQCWGYNANGQLGNNSTVNAYVPVGISPL